MGQATPSRAEPLDPPSALTLEPCIGFPGEYRPGSVTMSGSHCQRRDRDRGPAGLTGTEHRSRRELSSCLSPLFEPEISHKIVVDGEHGSVVQEQLVVDAGDGVLAPPLVVDAPVVLDGGYRARRQAALAPDRDNAPLVVGLHAERTGRVQRPQIASSNDGWSGGS